MACLKDSNLWKETEVARKMWTDTDKITNPKYYKFAQTIEKAGHTTDTALWNSTFEKATGGKLFELGENITAQDMKNMQTEIKYLVNDFKNPGMLNWNYVKHFFGAPSKVRKSPTLEVFLNEMQKATRFKNKHEGEMLGSYNDLIGSLKLAFLESGGVETSNFVSANKAHPWDAAAGRTLQKRRAGKIFDRLNEKEIAWLKASKDKKNTNVGKDWRALQLFLENEGVIFQDFVDRVQSGSDTSLRLKYSDKLKSKDISEQKYARNYINQLNNAASHWSVIESKGKKHLLNSIDNVSELVMLKYGKQSKVAEFLSDEYKKVKENLEAQKEGYLPHYVIDMMGTVIKMRDDIHKLKADEFTETRLDEILANYKDEIGRVNVALSSRLKGKSKDQKEYFSRNPMLYATKYIEQVVKFNHNAHADLAFTKGLNKFTETIFKNPDSDIANAAKVYKDILVDMHGKATGRYDMSGKSDFSRKARFLTSLTFISTQGLSLSTGVRNGTQRFLNIPQFGALTWGKAVARYRTDEVHRKAVDNEMEKHGLQYQSIESVTDGALTAADLIGIGVEAKDGTITKRQEKDIKELWKRKILAGTTKVAEGTAGITRYFENSNQKSTFNVAFYQRVEKLKRMDRWSNFQDPKVRDDIYAMAGHYAAKQVRLLHFGYTKFEKANILASPVGSVAWQFMHFAQSFAALNAEYMRRAWRNAESGEFNIKDMAPGSGQAAGIKRLLRFGTMYGLAELASIVSEVDFTGYLNHDLYERAKELKKLLIGGENEARRLSRLVKSGELSIDKYANIMRNSDISKEAQYGKGLVGAASSIWLNRTVEMINLGAAAGYWNLLADPNSTAGHFMGMREYKNLSNVEFMKRTVPFVNAEAGRWINKVGPSFWNLDILAAARGEFGLYPGETTLGFKPREAKKKLKNWLLPEEKDFKSTGDKSRDAAIKALSMFAP